MERADAILETVQRIHDAALTPAGWLQALSSIAEAVDGRRAFLVEHDAATGSARAVIGSGVTAEQLELFGNVASIDDLPPWATALPIGVATRTSAMMPDREFARSTFYNAVIRPMGDFYGLVSALPAEDRRRVFVAVGRPLGRDDYAAADLKVFQALMPHVRTALRVGRRLAGADLREKAAAAALYRLNAAVLVVDAAARIVFANQAAEAILARADGLQTDRDRLCTRHSSAAAALRGAIAACTSGGTKLGRSMDTTLIIPRAPGRQPLRATVTPLRADAVAAWTAALTQPVALIVIADSEAELQNRKSRLHSCFGLTAAETAVALEMLEGGGRAAVARRLGITVATVRTHLIHIFEKSGTRRQAELVRLILEL